jgi:hypothetical protein
VGSSPPNVIQRRTRRLNRLKGTCNTCERDRMVWLRPYRNPLKTPQNTLTWTSWRNPCFGGGNLRDPVFKCSYESSFVAGLANARRYSAGVMPIATRNWRVR